MRQSILHLTLFFASILIATSCTVHRTKKTMSQIDRAQQRSLRKEYRTLLASNKNNTKRSEKIELVEASKDLYTQVGLSGRTARRIQTMLDHQKQTVRKDVP